MLGVSAAALGTAFRSREFQSRAARYPDSVVASPPHSFLQCTKTEQ
jgi:hypothetical protein